MKRIAGTLRGAAGIVLSTAFLAGGSEGAFGGPNEAAARVEQLLQRLETQSKFSESRPDTYVLGEEDLNAFLAFRLRKYNPKGVESVRVIFRQDRLLVRGRRRPQQDGLEPEGPRGGPFGGTPWRGATRWKWTASWRWRMGADATALWD